MSIKPGRSVRWATVAAAALLGALGGCQGSRWERGLATGPDAAAPLAEGAPVRFREAPWERVEATMDELRRAEAATAVHPSEWSAEQKAEHKAKLLAGLQISEPAPQVRVVGRSEFRTTDAINVPSAELESLARGLGADTVVWTRKLMGKADRVVSEPATSFTDGTMWSRDAEGRLRSRSYSETRTDWIPVRVRVDETAYLGFFLATK